MSGGRSESSMSGGRSELSVSGGRSETATRPNKRRAGRAAGGLAVADSRPAIVDGVLLGARCSACGHALARADVPWCPACHGPIETAGFEPVGTVWAVTTVRIPVGRWSAPFALAYVDVTDGPRVLVHVHCAPPPAPGEKVAFTANADGDLVQIGLESADGTGDGNDA